MTSLLASLALRGPEPGFTVSVNFAAGRFDVLLRKLFVKIAAVQALSQGAF